MVLDDLVKVLQHASFISAVLAGFAVTLFVELITDAPKRRAVPYAAGSALVAAALLVIATTTGVSGVVAAILDPEAATGPAHQSTVIGAFQWTSCTFLLGMTALIVSLGFSGWVRSRRLGIVSSTIAIATIIALMYFLHAVVRGI